MTVPSVISYPFFPIILTLPPLMAFYSQPLKTFLDLRFPCNYRHFSSALNTHRSVPVTTFSLPFYVSPTAVWLGSHCSTKTLQLKVTSSIYIAKFGGNFLFEAFDPIGRVLQVFPRHPKVSAYLSAHFLSQSFLGFSSACFLKLCVSWDTSPTTHLS